MSIITNLELQNKFNITTENSIHKTLLIENEIKEIENYVNHIPVYTSPFRKETKPLTTNNSPKVFNFGNTYIDRKIFNESFYDYLNNGKPITIERLYNDNDEMHRLKQNSANQSIEIFKYYEWLKIQLSNPQKIEKKSEGLSHKEKMLALYYLGLDMRKFRNNLQSAKILSKILDLDESNTKDNLTYFDGINCKVKTEANLKRVLELFEHKDFKEIHTAITREIEK
jgi:hypothetical protein